ncbi:prephenate dehydrogenase [Nitritalea halalkaliphila LW7]|uniref:Prephenate dehydrogenase n=1 Tax=Nitritalea halalkaliphila LW7 TaxID=1189621 RepID=I5C3H7_9BACT|nr:prephenate dehydrogenase [Nitritalea halalkaliphila]EIM76379.1 prephenate dehydrogenase [Nitritalea halalkaliphila LW7]
MQHIHIIGLGLLGGSFGLALQQAKPELSFSGWDSNLDHAHEALALGLVQRIEETIPAETDVVLLATPVDTLPGLAAQVLEQVGPDTLVIDLGSTKGALCTALSQHPKRAQFLAGHPIAGTEYSGPRAATAGLLERKVFIVCEMERTDLHLKEKAYALLESLNMKLRFMDPEEHDRHLAFVSHLSHATSFMLGETVLQKMEDDRHIFDMAGSGFASTVRLAKSSPAMWTPIFLENRSHMLDALDRYIANLQELRGTLDRGDSAALHARLKAINRIQTILDLEP